MAISAHLLMGSIRGIGYLYQEALRILWKASFPQMELHGLISEQWKEMGWQGKDPSTDFRGGGFISLENLLYFARYYLKSFQDLLRKQEGDRSMWEYPFAVAGVNITFMLIQMLDLESVKPRTLVRATLKFLSDNESVFDLLYCIAYKLMDHQWLDMRASYMDFNICCDEINTTSAGNRTFERRHNTTRRLTLLHTSYRMTICSLQHLLVARYQDLLGPRSSGTRI
ncbi:uncharacterized protein [Rutidosis leptorrhynchoides]|uniref:uncharacterized protein isoform X1 n=1 Tax=Rutidosis leptorrhynchoides TaxID=125765 RepID=UPI003A9968E7